WFWLRPPPLANERRVGISLAQGFAFGLLVVAAGVLLYLLVLLPSGFFTASLPTIQNKVRAMGLDSPGKFLALACFYSLVHSFLEEYYWRWFVFRYCCLRWSLPTSIVVSSLGFMAHHVLVLATLFGWDAPATYLLSAAVAIGGAAWAWLYEKHGTLLGPWLSHLLIDALIFAIGYDLVFRVGG
ncbi:MAG TPA: CPBP family intramembrane glutamic endopeptidase, partial [Pirellulaceae bacterium]|nr:CPBP family intramembrane glutamic endopeptidase [Pirellulaceae bacterium]